MKYIDYFIHPKTTINSNAFYEARMHIVIIFCYLWVMSAFYIYYGFFSNTSSTEKQLILSLTTALTCGLFVLLATIKYLNIIKQCGIALLSATCLATVFIVYFTSGPINSPFTILAFIPAFLSFCLLGLIPGIIWSIVICFSLLLGFSYDIQGYDFPSFATEQSIDGSKAFSLMVVILVIINLVAIYEIMNVFLRKQVDAERDKYKGMANIALEGNIVKQTAQTLSTSGSAVHDATNQQKKSVEQLSIATEELGATAEQNSQMAKSAMNSIQQTNEYLSSSQDDIAELIQAMQDVSSLSSEIHTINNVINDISYQTNLLSLNAMIEASRLGEDGGFKVVALEVKKLAERSASAGDSIDKLLARNQTSVQNSVKISGVIKKRFTHIAEQIDPLVNDIQNVSDASHEQSVAIRQMQFNLDHIDQAIERNQQQAEKTAKLAEELSDNSTKMTAMLEELN